MAIVHTDKDRARSHSGHNKLMGLLYTHYWLFYNSLIHHITSLLYHPNKEVAIVHTDKDKELDLIQHITT